VPTRGPFIPGSKKAVVSYELNEEIQLLDKAYIPSKQ